MPQTKSKSPKHKIPHPDYQVAKNSSHRGVAPYTKAITGVRLQNLINTINNNRKDISKMHNNLPAKLMQLNNQQIINHSYKHQSQDQSQAQAQAQPQVYAKSISSSFSSVMHNGHTHSQGKRIVNESHKPYLQVDEMIDGSTQHYMIPKNSIPYKPILLHQQIKHSKSKSKPKSKTLVHSSKSKHTTKKHTKRTKHSPKK